jgi:TonB family protein
MNTVIAIAASSAVLLMAAPAGAKDELVLTDTAWIEAPSVADVAAAYPATAKAKGLKGEVMLNCVFGGTGRLGRCQTVSESPGAAGFALAARSLTGRFQGPTEMPDGRTIAGVHAQIVFKFAPDQLDAKTVARPEWTMLPTPAQFQAAFPDAASKAGVLEAKAVMNCTVTAAGGLTGCQAVSEDPAGYGFVAATLPLAGAFRLKTWTTDGQPVVGGVVRVPIRYDLKQVPAPAPAKP